MILVLSAILVVVFFGMCWVISKQREVIRDLKAAKYIASKADARLVRRGDGL